MRFQMRGARFAEFTRSPGASIDETTTASQAPSQALPNNSPSWAIWGSPPSTGAGSSLGGGFGSGAADRRGTSHTHVLSARRDFFIEFAAQGTGSDDSYPPPGASSSAFDGKQGSSALLENDTWNKSSMWAGEATSPGIANTTASPVRMRTNPKYESPKQSTDIPRSASPFYSMTRQAAVGRGTNLTQSPSSKGYLDPSSASFGDALEYSNNRGRPMEMVGQFGGQAQRFGATNDNGNGRHLGSVLAGAMENEGHDHLRRGRGLSNSRGIVPSTDHLSTAGRSESLPPQQRANSTPPTYNPDQSPPSNGAGYPSYTHIPTAHSGAHLSSHPIQGQPYSQGRYSDSRETRDAEMLAQVRQLSVEDDDLYQGAKPRPPYPAFSQTPPAGNINYSPQFGEHPYQRHPQGSHGSPWSPDEALFRGQEQFNDQFGEFVDGYGEQRLRSNERNGAMSPGEDYSRRNLGSPYYPAGTPPSGMESIRSPSRGGPTNRTPSGQIALHPEKLRQQLLVTQQQQQQNHHPAMLMRDSLFRPQQYPASSSYGYEGAYGGSRLAMPSFSGSMSPLMSPAQAGSSRRHDDFGSLRSALLEEFRSNSKSNRRYELKVTTGFLFFLSVCSV